MAAPEHWIRVQIGERMDLEAGWDYLWNELGDDGMADLVEFICKLSGVTEEKQYYIDELRGKFEDSPETSGVQSLRRAEILRHFQYIKRKLSEDWKENADLETYTFYSEYDPKQWFGGTGSFFGSAEGRMLALAYTGALKRIGFKVSGSNLPPEVCQD